MNKYLIVYTDADNRIHNQIVKWDAVTEDNIDFFETNVMDDEYATIINIIKLDM